MNTIGRVESMNIRCYVVKLKSRKNDAVQPTPSAIWFLFILPNLRHFRWANSFIRPSKRHPKLSVYDVIWKNRSLVKFITSNFQMKLFTMINVTNHHQLATIRVETALKRNFLINFENLTCFRYKTKIPKFINGIVKSVTFIFFYFFKWHKQNDE